MHIEYIVINDTTACSPDLAVPRQIARLNSDRCYQRQVSAAAIYSFFQDPFVRPSIEEKF